jgi:hypothetical protein
VILGGVRGVFFAAFESSHKILEFLFPIFDTASIHSLSTEHFDGRLVQSKDRPHIGHDVGGQGHCTPFTKVDGAFKGFSYYQKIYTRNKKGFK